MLAGMIFLAVAGLGMLFVFVIMPKLEAKAKTQNNNFTSQDYMTSERIVDIDDFYGIESIHNGFIYTKDGKVLTVGEMSGINFTTLTATEQNAREAALIEIFSQINYPIQFVTANTVVDTTPMVHEIARLAAQTDTRTNLYVYQAYYIGQLDLIKTQRSLNIQHTYIFVPGKNEDEAVSRLNSLINLLTSKTEIIARRVDNTDEIYDLFLNIVLPDNIMRPADMAEAGVTSPVHGSAKERMNLGN